MGVVLPQEAPYQYWNHVWGLTAFKGVSFIPPSPYPFGETLTWLIWDKRDTTVASAARTADLMARRWERLGGVSRPQYKTLPDIYRQALAEGGVRGFTFYIFNEAAEQALLGFGRGSVYQVPQVALLRSLACSEPGEREALDDLFEAADYAAGGVGRQIYFQSVVNGPGQRYEVTAWVVWESGSRRFDRSRLDFLQVGEP